MQRSTTISLQSGILAFSECSPNLPYPSETTGKKLVGLEGFEPPTHGLGNRFPSQFLVAVSSISFGLHIDLS